MILTTRIYHLSTCSLQLLTADLADTVAQRLASLDPWLTLGYQAERLSRYLQRADTSRHTFLILVSGQPAGVICWRYPWLFGPFLEILALYPQYRGRGLGREILEWLENHSESPNLWTSVSAFNLRALKFYATVGFVKVGMLPDLVRLGFNEILLRKIIRPPTS